MSWVRFHWRVRDRRSFQSLRKVEVGHSSQVTALACLSRCRGRVLSTPVLLPVFGAGVGVSSKARKGV